MTTTTQEHANWTAAGSDSTAQKTYASIRQALRDVESRRNVEIFLQGSYANSTNIRADSDVDIVVMSRTAFQGARENLSVVQKAAYDALPPSSFNAAALRGEVTAALTSYYGTGRVHPRNKCITVEGNTGYVNADVVPSIQYQWYPDANSLFRYVEGIAIFPLRGGRIVNFPKEHIKNGNAKNLLCGGHYKETVRQIKRLRNRAVDQGRLNSDTAPGYLLECMVYNVPAPEFVANDSERLSNVLLHLKFADKSNFFSCDGIHYLFKTDPGQFTLATAQAIVDTLWETY